MAVQQAPRTSDTAQVAAHGDVGAPASLRGWMVLGLGAAIASAYAAAYPLLGTAYPFGWDSPVYVWWSRVAESSGLSSPLIAARPGTVGVVAALAATLHVQTTTVVAALMLVAVSAASLAGAALVSQCLGPDRLRFVLVAVLLGGGMWMLVPGYLSTLMFAAVFFVALSLMVRSRSVASTGSAGLLLGLAGAAHPLFLGWAAAMMLPALVVVSISSRSRNRAFVVRTTASLLLGAAITGVALAVTGGLHDAALEFSRDGMLKTVGLSQLAVPYHQGKMEAAVPFFALALLSACLYLVCRRRIVWHEDAPPSSRVYVSAILGFWIVTTLVAAMLLMLSVPVPAQRLVKFCLPLSLLTAVGVAAALRPEVGLGRSPAVRAVGRRVLVALAMLAVWIGVGIAAVGWWAEAKSSVMPRQSLATEGTVAAAVAATPLHTPVVIATDGPDDAVIAKRETLLRNALPPETIGDVHFFIGSPADVQADRVRLAGVPERDRIAQLHWVETRPLLAGRALVLSIGPARSGGPSWSEVGNSVLVLHTPGRTVVNQADIRRALQTGAFPSADVSPAAPFVLAIALVLVLGLVGWPFTRLLAGDGCTEEVAFGLAPAVGLAVVMAAAIAASAAGVRFGSLEGQMLITASIGGAIAACVMARFRRAPRPTMVTSLDGSPA